MRKKFRATVEGSPDHETHPSVSVPVIIFYVCVYDMLYVGCLVCSVASPVLAFQ